MFAFGACGSKPSAGEAERSGEGGSGSPLTTIQHKSTANRSNHSATEARSRRTLRYERLRAATATIKRCARALAPFVAACVARTRERERTKAPWERTQQARRRQLRRWSQVPTKASADAAAQSNVLKGARALLQELLSDFKGSTSRRASARAAATNSRPST